MLVFSLFFSALAKIPSHGLSYPVFYYSYLLPFLVQFWMFSSPVAYPSSLVPQRWRTLYGLNPMAGVIEGFRWALTGQGQPPNMFLAASAAVVLLVGIGGVLYFRKMEDTI